MYNVHTDALASLNSFTVLQCKVVESDMKKYILALSDQAWFNQLVFARSSRIRSMNSKALLSNELEKHYTIFLILSNEHHDYYWPRKIIDPLILENHWPIQNNIKSNLENQCPLFKRICIYQSISDFSFINL